MWIRDYREKEYKRVSPKTLCVAFTDTEAENRSYKNYLKDVV